MSRPRYRPAEGRRVLHPNGVPVAQGGEVLPNTPYFARKIADGDLVAVPVRQGNPKRKTT